MHYLNTYNKKERATVCANKTCITVYGETARIVNSIAVTAASIMLLALLAKVLR